MPEISEKAKQVLDYIETRVEEGFPPSVREICRDLRIKSTSTAHKYLTELRDKGFIEKGDNLNRAIRLTKQHPDGIPLLGTVTAASLFWLWRKWKATFPIICVGMKKVRCLPFMSGVRA